MADGRAYSKLVWTLLRHPASIVIPAKAGIQRNRHHTQCLDSGLRRNDKNEFSPIREMP